MPAKEGTPLEQGLWGLPSCGQDSALPGWTDSPKVRLQRSREDSAAALQPRPASRSSLLDAQPCCFSPSLYSDSEFPSPDGPSPPTKDICGAQVSAPSLYVCVRGGRGMANPGFPSLDPEISGVTEHLLLKAVKALSPCFPICSPQAHHNPPRSSECKRLGLGWSWGGGQK